MNDVLTDSALAFVRGLHERFEPRRAELLEARARRRARLAAGGTLDFLPETRSVRETEWTIAPVPPDLRDRRVEITGPVERKMMINALNSGATGFMADFEDSLSPTWENVVAGQVNLRDAVAGTIAFEDRRLGQNPATLIVRPRGWHLPEPRLEIAAAFVDAGLYLFHNARALLERGSGPYFYLPKTESHLEARLWNDVFAHSERELGLDAGAIKATVLIETLPAAFEMEEILYELRDRAAGLNAGRWDYIFSTIKSFPERPEFVLPDRADVKMTVPFMRAYTELLVKTCHRRGAHAMGGMAALLPSRKDPEANERAVEAVRADKRREAGDGFDGTWVAHPDVVPVARAEFDAVLAERPNQVERLREDVDVGAAELLDIAATPGAITEPGVRGNVSVAIQYISSWLRGNGAAAINGLMEDAATAEIARSQVWQWIRHGRSLEDGTPVTAELIRRIADEEVAALDRPPAEGARELFEEVALARELPEFLTLRALGRLTASS